MREAVSGLATSRPDYRFMGDPASVFPGDVTCVLETAGGVKVTIFFTNSNGAFRCQVADEAKAALAAGGSVRCEIDVGD
jgi:hypothetical protein